MEAQDNLAISCAGSLFSAFLLSVVLDCSHFLSLIFLVLAREKEAN